MAIRRHMHALIQWDDLDRVSNFFDPETTPLIYAVKYTMLDMVELLLMAGADPNLRHAGDTPLMVAVASNHRDSHETVRLLLEHKADVSCENELAMRNSLPHVAVARTYTDLRKLDHLLDHGMRTSTWAGRMRRTPYEHAVAIGNKEAARRLLAAREQVWHTSTHTKMPRSLRKMVHTIMLMHLAGGSLWAVLSRELLYVIFAFVPYQFW